MCWWWDQVVTFLSLCADDIGMQSAFLTFSSTSESIRCVEIDTLQDNVIESDETFRVYLSLITTLPGSLHRNLMVDTSPLTITIQDTSEISEELQTNCNYTIIGVCTDILLDPSHANSMVYVRGRRSLCFSCPTCGHILSWNVTTDPDRKWTGETGEDTLSNSFGARILANGTLVIMNSSLVFSGKQPGTISFEYNNPDPSSSSSSVYDFHIQIGKIHSFPMVYSNELLL
jgi:hypothetical protein